MWLCSAQLVSSSLGPCEVADYPWALDIQADCVEHRRLLADQIGKARVPKDDRKLTIF